MCMCVIYELLSSQLSTRVKFTYINSEKKVNINSNRNCKPGANSLWFNSFTLEISLTFLGQTVSHLQMYTFMAREKAERCGLHLSSPHQKSAFERLGSGVLEEKGSSGLYATLRVLEKPDMETHRYLILSLARGEKISRPSASDHQPC